MLRWIPIAAVASSVWVGAAWAQTVYTYGVFRENAPDLPITERNCWTQALISGQTINGELIVEGLTQPEAAQTVKDMGIGGLCANQRTATNWVARHENNHGSHHAHRQDWNGQGGQDHGRHRRNRTSDGSNGDNSVLSGSGDGGPAPLGSDGGAPASVESDGRDLIQAGTNGSGQTP